MLLVATVAIVLLVLAPAVVGGAPLADDYEACIALEERTLAEHLERVTAFHGLVRPVRLAEVSLTATICPRAPFGLLVAVPLALTVGVAWAARALLRDLGGPEPWASGGAALFLVHPVGAEAALWPAALHVPLGLLAALAGLLALRRGRTLLGVTLALLACLSTEHVLFALPAAAYLVAPPERRRRAGLVTGAIVAAVLAFYASFPGTSPRTTVGVVERLANLIVEPGFYPRFAAVGLGMQAVPAAFVWAGLAIGLIAVVGAAAWWWWACAGGAGAGSGGPRPRAVLAGGSLLVLLVNVPVMTTLPRDHSPRLFTATWLVLCMVGALLAGALGARSARVVALGAGAFAGAAVLALALSVAVRQETASFNRTAFAWIAARVDGPGAHVAVCGVEPRAVDPAPRGAYTLHELFYDWAPSNAMRWHTGESARFTLYRGAPCPAGVEADLTVDFDDLVLLHRGRAGGGR